MNIFAPIVATAERHTLPTTLVCSLSGFFGLILDHIDVATKFVVFTGAAAGTITALLGLVIMWRKERRNRAWHRMVTQQRIFRPSWVDGREDDIPGL